MFLSQEQFILKVKSKNFEQLESELITKFSSSNLTTLILNQVPDTNLECLIDANSNLNYTFNLNQNSKLKLVLITKNIDSDFNFNLEINLQADKANFELFFLNQQTSNNLSLNLQINHLGGNTASKTLIKSINQNNSKFQANGTIYIAKKAVNSEAKMNLKGLLIDKNSQIIFQPNLKILESQVSCSHGATISNFDEVYLEYFSSRGIDTQNAKQMLMDSFKTEITKEIPLVCLS